MRVKVLAFARVAELLGWASREIDAAPGAKLRDVWQSLQAVAPALAPLADSTRIALNGRIVNQDELLTAGDEISLLPPAGGG